MPRERTLSDGTTTFRTVTDGTGVEISTTKNGKDRVATKTFPDAGAARSWAEAQERTRLRKGFILAQDPDTVSPCEPFLTVALPRAYTGALPVADRDGTIVTAFHDDGEDVIVTIDQHAHVTPLARTAGLVWQLAPTASGLLALVDHRVVRIDPTGSLEPLTDRPQQPCSVLAASGTRVVWYQRGRLEVVDLADGQPVWSRAVDPELHGGHTPVLTAALSTDHVAYSDGRGEVALVHLESGHEQRATGFAMPDRLAFWGDHLVVHDLYAHGQGTPHLHVLDLASFAPAAWWTPSPSFGSTPDLAVSPSGDRLAVGDRVRVSVHRLGTTEPDLDVLVDHSAATQGLAWQGEGVLLARVDAGFLTAIRVAP